MRKPSPDPPPTGADALKQGVVAQAYRKVMAGQQLSREEQAALHRHEKEKEERLRWQYYKSIPQKHWRKMSGRQAKVINEQAARYGLPFDGATIDLPAVVRALHDFLSANALRLAGDDAMMSGAGSPALEKYREERAALARLDRMEREGALVARDEVRTSFGRIAAILRSAGDALQRDFGPAAVDILYEALDDSVREAERIYGEESGNHEPDPG